MAHKRDTNDERVIAFGENIATYSGCYGDRNYVEARKNQENKFGLSEWCRDAINKIKNNDPESTRFSLDSGIFSDLAWKLLGRYIAANDHLITLDLSDLQLTDAKVSLLFENLTGSSSLTTLKIARNCFGLNGIRNMVPFLNCASKLATVDIGRNSHINNECFRILIEALDGCPIKEVICGGYRVEGGSLIDDVTVLGQHTLPQLEFLKLDSNNIQALPSLQNHACLERIHLRKNSIGSNGCRPIADLLQNRSFSVKMLNLTLNNIGDEEVKILAESLKENSTLEVLELDNVYDFTPFGADAFRAILKLLNDVSSINGTYNSNHTLRTMRVPCFNDYKEFEIEKIKQYVEDALNINRLSDRDPHAAGREKVIESQLNSRRRKDLSCLQGIDRSYSSLFAGIDVILLPNILALTLKARVYPYYDFSKKPLTDLYHVLDAMVSYLSSIQESTTRKAKRKRENQ